MKRLTFAIFALSHGINFIAMDVPMTNVGTKRSRAQEENPLQELPSAQAERVETPEEREQRIDLAVQELRSKASLPLLPEEVLAKIIDELIPAKGFGREKLYNAARNIRNFLISSKDFSAFASNKEFNGKLIKKRKQA